MDIVLPPARPGRESPARMNLSVTSPTPRRLWTWRTRKRRGETLELLGKRMRKVQVAYKQAPLRSKWQMLHTRSNAMRRSSRLRSCFQGGLFCVN
eukprot:s27_g29.t1